VRSSTPSFIRHYQEPQHQQKQINYTEPYVSHTSRNMSKTIEIDPTLIENNQNNENMYEIRNVPLSLAINPNEFHDLSQQRAQNSHRLMNLSAAINQTHFQEQHLSLNHNNFHDYNQPCNHNFNQQKMIINENNDIRFLHTNPSCSNCVNSEDIVLLNQTNCEQYCPNHRIPHANNFYRENFNFNYNDNY
jgi:hypothetical protein